MKKGLIVFFLMLAVAGVLALRERNAQPPEPAACCPGGADGVPCEPAVAPEVTAGPRPRLLSLGAGACVPCRMMEPVREALKREYAGRLDVEFIDVWQDREAGQRYGIRTIPTLIFYGADGSELARREGFMPKEDVLKQWAEVGVDLAAEAQP